MQGNTIQQLLAERIETFATGDKPTEIIDKAVEKLFKDLVDEAFKSWGDFGQAVKASVKAAMPANVSDMFELTRYNTLIVNALRERWQSSVVTDDFLRRAQASLDEVINAEAIPKQVKLSDLLDAFVEQHREEAVENGWDSPRILIKDDDRGNLWHYITIAFDKQPEESYQSTSRSSYGSTSRAKREEYQLDNRISVWVKGTTDAGDPIGYVYSAQLEGKPVGRDFSITHRWERLVAALYFGVAELIVDCDEHSVSYPGRD